MSKIISTTITNPNGKEDTCALVQVTGQELYYLLRPIEIVGKYTISFFVKAQADETIILHYGNQTKEVSVTTSWQRVTFSFNAEYIDNVMIQFTTGNYYLYNTQLENGDVATTYTLSPEDAEKQLKDVENTLTQMYSEVVQSLNSFKVEVGANYSTKDSVKAQLEVKVDKNDNDQIVAMINASADEINLKANRFSLESDNTSISKDGVFKTVSGEIGGWDITEDGISKETEAYVPPTNAHGDKIREYLSGQVTLDDAELLYFDINGDGVVDLKDAYLVRSIARGEKEYSQCAGAIKSPLRIIIDSTDGTETIKFTAINPIGEVIESYIGVSQFKTLAFVGDTVFANNIEGNIVQTKSGANLDTVKTTIDNMFFKAESLVINAQVSVGAQTSVTTYESRGISNYDLISMTLSSSTNDVLTEITVPKSVFANSSKVFKLQGLSGSAGSLTFDEMQISYESDTRIKIVHPSTSSGKANIVNMYGYKLNK